MTAVAHPLTDPFDAYLSEVRDIPVLTPDEERCIARRYRDQHDPSDARLLVRGNLRFVVWVARQYASEGVRMADLVQEGNLGLLQAVERFDPEREVRLVSYASTWIRARMLNHILQSWSLVKLGTTAGQRRLFFALAREEEKVSRELGADQDVATSRMVPVLARCLGVTPAAVEEMRQRLSGRDVSLDAPPPGGGLQPLEHVASGETPQDERLCCAEQAAGDTLRVRAALGCLDERERLVIELRVMADDPLTLEAVGERLGCGRERVRQLEVRAKEKLRRCLDAGSAGPCDSSRVVLRRRRPSGSGRR